DGRGRSRGDSRPLESGRLVRGRDLPHLARGRRSQRSPVALHRVRHAAHPGAQAVLAGAGAAEGVAADRGEELNAKKTPARRAKARPPAKKAKGRGPVGAGVSASASEEAAVAAPAAPAPRQESAFERFVLDFVRARGGSITPFDNGDVDAQFDPELAKRL